ncbi:MAG: hypothetical protein K940chlam3_00203 [Chlamydiae bacterium]|nr:hypothetical protein [Chlamydiota bacterium]
MAKLKSMTAFGRASQSSSIGTFHVEAQSVNRKHLDVKVLCPSKLRPFEVQVQRRVAARINRGHIVINISLDHEEAGHVLVRPNIELARQIKEAGDTLVEELQLDDPNFSSKLVGFNKELLLMVEEEGDENEYLIALNEAVDSALEQLDLMRTFEGDNLAKDIESRIHLLEKGILEIEKEVEGTVDKRREKLKEVIESVLPVAENEESLLREVAFYAEKVDVQEEITRFKSHLEHFLKTMDEEGAVGKKLEFIVQELFREINTVASKSPEVSVKYLTIEMKAEIERIREQVQNIE